MGKLSDKFSKFLPDVKKPKYWTIKSIKDHGDYLKNSKDFHVVYPKDVSYNRLVLPSCSWLKENEKKFSGGLKKIPDTIDKAIINCKDINDVVELEKKSMFESAKIIDIKDYISELETNLGGRTDRRIEKSSKQLATYKRCKFIDEKLYKPDTEYYELCFYHWDKNKLIPKDQLDNFLLKMKEQHPAENEREKDYRSTFIVKGYETDWVSITLPKVIKKEELDEWMVMHRTTELGV